MRSTYYLISVFAIIVSSVAHGFECNRSASLCSMRYNEVAYPMAHNAQSYKKNWIFWPIPGSNINDQSRSLDQQLADGIQAIKLPIHPYQGHPYVCHGFSEATRQQVESYCGILGFFNPFCKQVLDEVNPCGFDPAAAELKQVLQTVARFLRDNPTEVITVFLEDWSNDFEMLQKALDESGLSLFARAQDLKQAWPTLEEMVKSNTRAVVFIDIDRDQFGRQIGSYPGFNPTNSFVWRSHYNYDNVLSLENDDVAYAGSEGRAFLDPGKSVSNKLVLLWHFVTPALAGSPQAAKSVNEAEFLRRRIGKYKMALGTNPNFVAVDFYHLPKAKPGLFDVVSQINDGLETKSAVDPTK